MPHVKIGYPHKTKDGTKRAQGDIVYVSPQEARDLVDGGKGKIVRPSPQEIVDLHKPKQKDEPKAIEPAKAEAPKDESKAKLPARKAPADG
ncbi:hypothetical protein [Nocardiopsis synnemataformans]|uniref:hypothetical protein n=1 Tax=Nocardiopsis synnemataformans TaxID=61305 RepID=UPI003EBB00A7